MATPGGTETADAGKDQELTLDTSTGSYRGPINEVFKPEDGELGSPDGEHRRRSTRASALRAQEKMRGKWEDLPENEKGGSLSPGKRPQSGEPEKENGDDSKKRRLAKDMMGQLDPTNPHFAIQQEEDGEVVVLSDDSEVSSLHDSEIDAIRKNYLKVTEKEQTQEQKLVRERMIRQLQAELRLEEAKLVMLKRLRQSQQMSQKESNMRQQPSNLSTGNKYSSGAQGRQVNGTSNGAYRPPVANANPPPLARAPNKPNSNSTNSQQRPQLPAHQARPQLPPHLGGSVARGGSGTPPSNLSKTSDVHSQPRGPIDTQTPAQRQAAAKLQLRKQLEKTLLQIPPPKPPPPEMHFVPNPNQPEFVYLLGLDHVVQRVLKDKRASEAHHTEPYKCLQCDTDFTPLWKAVPKSKDITEESDESQMRLMCEQCVRTNQKKSLKAEHTNRLKQAFVKALEQEQEIEKQIKEGKFNSPPPSALPEHTKNSSAYPTASRSPAVRGSPSTAAGGVSGTGQKSSKPSTSSSLQQTQQQMAHAAATAAIMGSRNPAAMMTAGVTPQQLQSYMQMMANMTNPSAWTNPLLGAGVSASQYNNAGLAAANQAMVALMQAQRAGATPGLSSLFGGLNPSNAATRQFLMDMMPKQSQPRKN